MHGQNRSVSRQSARARCQAVLDHPTARPLLTVCPKDRPPLCLQRATVRAELGADEERMALRHGRLLVRGHGGRMGSHQGPEDRTGSAHCALQVAT